MFWDENLNPITMCVTSKPIGQVERPVNRGGIDPRMYAENYSHKNYNLNPFSKTVASDGEYIETFNPKKQQNYEKIQSIRELLDSGFTN